MNTTRITKTSAGSEIECNGHAATLVLHKPADLSQRSGYWWDILIDGESVDTAKTQHEALGKAIELIVELGSK